MDQDSFRQLLSTAPPPSTSSVKKSKAKIVDASQPAFKPRKVKKNEEKGYRDRAAERRTGGANEYTQVEAVLEQFEKQHAGEDKAMLDSQRRYLGGDGAHSILVKGLDIALLEQNKARAAVQSTLVDDDDLEKAFLEASDPSPTAAASLPAPPAKKKRTREELIRELKAKRAAPSVAVEEDGKEPKAAEKKRTKEEEAKVLEDAKRAGKFRPIGFKPIGGGSSSSSEVKKKKKKVKVEGEGEKKTKRKVEKAVHDTELPLPTATQHSIQPTEPPAPEPEPLPEDVDIFAGVGEYDGLQLDSDEDEAAGEAAEPSPGSSTKLEEGEESEQEDKARSRPLSPPRAAEPRKWIDTGSPEPEPSKPDLLKSVLKSTASSSSTNGKGKAVAGDVRAEHEEAEEGELEHVTRLVPLASSALPSIKEFLAMEAASGGRGKRRKRKGGGGGAGAGGEDGEGKKRNTEAKVERDYKRLKTYTDKKEAA